MKKTAYNIYSTENELFGKKFIYTFSNELTFFDQFESTEIYQKNKTWLNEIQLASGFLETYYLAIESNAEIVILSSFQVIKINAQNIPKKEETSITSIVSSLFFMLNKPNLLVLGNIFRTQSPHFVCNNVNNSDAFEIILNAATHLATKIHPTLLVLKEIPKNQSYLLSISKHNFSSTIADPTMQFSVLPEWKSLADYEKALSRKYAARMQKIIAQRANFDCKELNMSEINEYADQIHALYKSTLQSQEIVLYEAKSNYWSDLKNIYQENFKLYGIFIKSKLVAFYTTFEESACLEMYYVGFDSLANQKLQLYFNILFYGVETAILSQKNTIKLGRTAWDAKYSLGAVAVENEIHLKAICLKGKMLDAIISCSKYFSKPQTINRNPFKKNTSLQYSEI